MLSRESLLHRESTVAFKGVTVIQREHSCASLISAYRQSDSADDSA